MLRWHCRPCSNVVVTLYPQQHCCPCCNCVIAVLKLTSLLLSQLRCHRHQCTGVLAIITIAWLPSLQWHCCPQCTGIFTFVAIAIVALMTMSSLPLSMCRRSCHCQAGVVSIVTMVLLPLICNSFVALVTMALLHPQAGIVALVAILLSSSSICRRPCCHCDGVVALNAFVVAINAQASLPLS